MEGNGAPQGGSLRSWHASPAPVSDLEGNLLKGGESRGHVPYEVTTPTPFGRDRDESQRMDGIRFSMRAHTLASRGTRPQYGVRCVSLPAVHCIYPSAKTTISACI